MRTDGTRLPHTLHGGSGLSVAQPALRYFLLLIFMTPLIGGVRILAERRLLPETRIVTQAVTVPQFIYLPQTIYIQVPVLTTIYVEVPESEPPDDRPPLVPAALAPFLNLTLPPESAGSGTATGNSIGMAPPDPDGTFGGSLVPVILEPLPLPSTPEPTTETPEIALPENLST